MRATELCRGGDSAPAPAAAAPAAAPSSGDSSGGAEVAALQHRIKELESQLAGNATRVLDSMTIYNYYI